jgi:parvulin-like peptidyl-prolyl isomerase
MRSTFLLAAAALLVLPALAGDPPLDAPLIVDGPIKVDAGDFLGAMERVPPETRSEFRTSYERIAGMVDNIFVARSFASKAREAGLDKDPVVQRRLAQAQDALLADLYIKRLDEATEKMDFDQRARELYDADATRYVKPEQVYVQHILIGLTGRTREMALERAKQVYDEAKSGKEDFLSLAARYSDDPDKKRNGGDLGWNSPKSFVPPVTEWIDKAARKDEISPPIESYMGFHIVRFVDRQKPEPMKFEAVKASIIKAEKERLAKKRLEDAIRAVRESKSVVIHKDNVEAFVVSTKGVFPPIDPFPTKPAK